MSAATYTLVVRNVRVIVEPDDYPDLSWLEQDYEGEPDAELYKAQDKRRLDAYHNGEWYMVGVYATAEVIREFPNGGYQHVATARSGGLWGIESDSDPEYFKSVGDEQLDELKDILADMGIAAEQITAAIDAADR
jgi:hypothetical protein